jgi:uncharacterized SAM-binding protein YcdF (DUF218 family)
VSGAVSRRLIVALAIALALGILWVSFAGRLLVATDPPGRPEAVFALSGDVLGDRVRRAIEVAAQTHAARLIFFVDTSPRPESPPEIRHRATEAGVPVDAIRFVSGVDSTAMEASFAAGLADRCGWSDIVVVTSPYHTRRAAWTFNRAVGDEVQVRAVASGDVFDETDWWRTPRGREVVLGEWAKLIGASWYVVRPPESLVSDTPC